MRPTVLLLLVAVFGMGMPAFADEEPVTAVTIDTEAEVTDVNVDAPPRLGMTGYGTPVLSDRVALGEIYGARSGYVHPFLSIGGYHTDNLFRTPDNEESDWVAVITPGIWFSVPATHQKLLEISLLNTAPGGLAVDRFRTESERRFQGYALYRADIVEHDQFTDENRIDHRGEGLLKISLRGGLSLELVDVYEVNHDPYGTGGTVDRQLDKYTANLFNAILAYQLSPKVMLRADYGNYNLNYDDTRNVYRDRTDNTFSAYLFYQATPKTAIFLQSEYVDIDYDKDINVDSEQLNYFLGIEMKVTSKTRALVKIGYGQKDYDDATADDSDNLLGEGQIDYAFSPKTSIYVRGAHRVLESDEIGAQEILSTRIQIGYRQRIMTKLRAETTGFYILNEYDGLTTIGTRTDDREDDEYGCILALGYSPFRWATVTFGYEYRERNSNFNTEDYQANTVFLRMTGTM